MEPEAFRTLLDSLGANEETLSRAPAERIDLTNSLEALSLPAEARLEISLREVLGVGGMGSVHLAEQVALRRDVAAKVPVKSGSEQTRRAILREAWITGALEHPHIVPIYDVVTLDDGEPCVLMKRVEGVSWLECIDDPSRFPEARGNEGEVERSVTIALALCDALHFAHDRNVLHRDVKPANVMLGAFGEIYLVDWGIAAAYGRGDASAAKAPEPGRTVSGTPVYMAPEMAQGRVEALGPWTDVYLVGATLHHALTGAPPHAGQSVFESLYRAVRSRPATYESLPRELAEILRRSMAADPADRQQSADELGQELRAFLRHRASRELTGAADARAAKAEALGPGDTKRGAWLTEARAGYRQALVSWSENDEAQEGLVFTTIRLAELELNRDNLHAAESLIDELAEAPERLQAEVARLRERVEAQRHEVRTLRLEGIQRDPTLGARGRAIAAAAFAAVCFANLTVLHFFRGHPSTWSAGEYVLDAVLSLALALGTLVVFVRTFRRNRANRDVGLLLFFSTGIVLVERLGVAAAGFSFTTSIALEHFMYASVAGGLASAIGYRLFFPSIAFAGGGLFGLLYPEWILLGSAVSVAVALLGVAWLWWPRARWSAEPRASAAGDDEGALLDARR